MTTNIANDENDYAHIAQGATSVAFGNAVGVAAPLAAIENIGNYNTYNPLALGSYTAFSTSAAKYATYNGQSDHTVAMYGVFVKSDKVASGNPTFVVSSGKAIKESDILKTAAPSATDVSFTFNGVNTGDAAKNASMDQQAKVAYISGSAAVIQSKFINLTNVEVVKYMDSTTEAGRIFRLGNTLAPRVVR